MGLTSTDTAQVDAQSEEWFASYAEPSHERSNRSRHTRHRRSVDPRRHRLRRLNTIMMIASVVFVSAMIASFYVILTR